MPTHTPHRSPAHRWLRRAGTALGLLALLLAGLVLLHQITPRPAVTVIRWLFDEGARSSAAALEPHVPQGVQALRDQPVLTHSGEVSGLPLDLYRPAGWTPGQQLPAIVWVHGGAWVAGNKRDVDPWLRLLASHGFVTVAPAYTRAPEARFPTPLHQLNAALAHLDQQADALGIDRRRILLAGDSAGAHLAALLAHVHVQPAHAQRIGIRPALQPAQLRGMLLFCGPFDFDRMNFDGAFGPFMNTVVRAFFGQRDARQSPAFRDASVLPHLDAAFPPTFVSAGNADPLLDQSLLLQQRLQALGVPVEGLFFAADHQPPLGHEYQFNQDLEAGRRALATALDFARRRTAP